MTSDKLVFFFSATGTSEASCSGTDPNLTRGIRRCQFWVRSYKSLGCSGRVQSKLLFETVYKEKVVTSTNNDTKGKLKSLDEIFKPEEVVRCECGSATFLDWGMQLLDTSARLKGPRLDRIAQSNSVKICTNCHMPVIHYSGDLYNASTFVDKEAIDQVIQSNQTQTQRVPVKAGV